MNHDPKNHAASPLPTVALDPEAATINGPMGRFVAALAAGGHGNPLTRRLPLPTIWGALRELTGDARSSGEAALPEADRRDSRAAGQHACPASQAIAGAFAALHGELLAEGVPDPLARPFVVGLVWADLCALTGEEPPPMVLALLDDRAAA